MEQLMTEMTSKQKPHNKLQSKQNKILKKHQQTKKNQTNKKKKKWEHN